MTRFKIYVKTNNTLFHRFTQPYPIKRSMGEKHCSAKNMRLIFALIAMLALTACRTYTDHLISDKGDTIAMRYRDGEGTQLLFFGDHEVEGFLAVFRLAVPLDKQGPAESKADMIFTHRFDGKEVSKYILCRDGELFHDGKWFVVDKDWLYRWQSEYDPRNSRRPNN